MATILRERSSQVQEGEPSESRRTRRAPPALSRLELACMKTIWCDGAKTVHHVQQRLQPKRPLAYTTILTVLDRLVRKGALTRVKQGRVHTYEPVLSLAESRHKAVVELVDFFFEGSFEKLHEFLASSLIPSEFDNSSQESHPESPEISVALL